MARLEAHAPTLANVTTSPGHLEAVERTKGGRKRAMCPSCGNMQSSLKRHMMTCSEFQKQKQSMPLEDILAQVYNHAPGLFRRPNKGKEFKSPKDYVQCKFCGRNITKKQLPIHNLTCKVQNKRPNMEREKNPNMKKKTQPNMEKKINLIMNEKNCTCNI